MDRRKFIIGSAAVSAATVAVAATGASATALPLTSAGGSNKTSPDSQTQWRLQYPLTKEEKAAGTVVHDLTYPTNDMRRYKSPGETVDRNAKADFSEFM